MPRTRYTATVRNGKFVLDNPITDLPEGTVLFAFGPKERELFVLKNADRSRHGAPLLTWDEFVDEQIRASSEEADGTMHKEERARLHPALGPCPR